MKRIVTLSGFILILLVMVFVPVAHSQIKSAAQLEAEEAAAQAEIQREELVNLEKETARALQLNNATFFKRVYGDDFIGTSAYGLMVSKAALIAIIQSAASIYSSFVASDIKVRVYQDTAVVTCLWSARGITKGHSFSFQSRVLHVYINGPRGWQAVASQETLLSGQSRE